MEAAPPLSWIESYHPPKGVASLLMKEVEQRNLLVRRKELKKRSKTEYARRLRGKAASVVLNAPIHMFSMLS
jgi:hypothetical protein